MKIVTAFDSFKGCMSSLDACQAASMGIKESFPDAVILNIPLSDGGEGFIDCLSHLLDVNKKIIKAHGPLMETIDAEYLISSNGKTAYMEMATTSGLTLVPVEKRNPEITTTYGVGDMIADAVNSGCSEIIIGLGGSATIDAGKGMIESLRDKKLIEKTSECHFKAAYDVGIPLCGPKGAALNFGLQKGATEEQALKLDKILQNYSKEVSKDGLEEIPGTGAAGGLGFGLKAFFNAELISGIDLLLDITKFDKAIEKADFVLTGEGKSDAQTLMGKVAYGVWKRCKLHSIPVALLSGEIEDNYGRLAGMFEILRSINKDDCSPKELLIKREIAMKNMQRTASAVFNL